MKVVIIEDEETARTRLKKILSEQDFPITLLAELDSIISAVQWFVSNPPPDLIFADIQLADGPSFEIFKSVNVSAPVIFITAFDNHALEAFRANGIDYLLKPIKKAEVESSIQKFRMFQKTNPPSVDYKALFDSLVGKKPVYQKRLLIKIGQSIRTIEIADVAYFYTEEKIAFACLRDAKRSPVDFTLDELESMLNPADFFRINRQFIVYIKAIESMTSYSKSRIKLTLQPPTETETIVSSERAADFKEWLLGKEPA